MGINELDLDPVRNPTLSFYPSWDQDGDLTPGDRVFLSEGEVQSFVEENLDKTLLLTIVSIVLYLHQICTCAIITEC
jgi:hypothetical protein